MDPNSGALELKVAQLHSGWWFRLLVLKRDTAFSSLKRRARPLGGEEEDAMGGEKTLDLYRIMVQTDIVEICSDLLLLTSQTTPPLRVATGALHRRLGNNNGVMQ